MPEQKSFRDQITSELARAAESRKQGNEGRARVCARRAVGIAIVSYYASRNLILQESDFMFAVKKFRDDISIPLHIRQMAARLSERITSDFQYASPTDPLTDAQLIIDYVMEERKQS